MIPKILHFTWKSADLPGTMGAFFAKWQRLHPDWDIRLWTDETMHRFVVEAYPELLATYDGYPKMIQRADAFRYLVLGKLGGIYSDLDVEPFQSVAPLLDLDCFVGVEPLEHIGTDRTHQGIPLLLSNAFMGSVPGHPMWREVCRLLPELADQETFYSTGPSMVTAVALRLSTDERPALLLPEVWSPKRSNGVRTTSDARLKQLLAPVGRVVEAVGGTLVSHEWHTTWVPWHKRNSRFSGLVQWPTRIKWWLRRRRHPDLVAMRIPDPAEPYWEQQLRPVAELPRVHVALLLGDGTLSEDLAAAISGLTYPAKRLKILALVSGAERSLETLRSCTGHGWDVVRSELTGAAACNALLEAAADADHVLVVDGRVQSFPPDAIEQLLSAGRPVAAANCVDATGANGDAALFRYKFGGKFEVLYKEGAATGPVKRDPGHRTYLGEQTVFNVLPLDGVGESFVLIGREVIAAGVRFGEVPYKAHLGGEAFGIMARDRGFEAAGLPGLRVVVGNWRGGADV